jgi:uncharacterized membrane protein (UPF0127 family)
MRTTGILLFLLFCCDSPVATVAVEIGGEIFRVEVARTVEEQRLGLMNREHLGERRGMLFVYSTDRRLTFWMKDTRIPLSIAFLNKEGVILQIEDMEPLDLTTIRSRISARYALEVNQGAFDEVGVTVGDRIALPEEVR